MSKKEDGGIVWHDQSSASLLCYECRVNGVVFSAAVMTVSNNPDYWELFKGTNTETLLRLEGYGPEVPFEEIKDLFEIRIAGES